MTYGITYCDASMSMSANRCIESMLLHNVQDAKVCTQTDLPVDWVKANKALLSEPRGIGYWAWKAALIDIVLGSMQPNDILVYSDAGVEFINNINYVVEQTKDVFFFGNMWEHRHWCKGDAIEAVIPGWDGDDRQIQASVLVFRKTAYSVALVKEWLALCCVKQLIDDSPSIAPNREGFREHRHDQAILTCLAIRDKIPLHWWPASYNDGAFSYPKNYYEQDNYPVLFNHHRKRNS